jgi:site-specific DNA-methyltransferase (adenine-specific)
MLSGPSPYYQDDLVTLYQGDCLELLPTIVELDGVVVVSDPPYGIAWQQSRYNQGRGHDAIAGDGDTSVRDAALELIGGRPGAWFGHWRRPIANAVQVLVYAKARDAGVLGSTTGFRTDFELIYLTGAWPKRPAIRSSILTTSTYLRTGGDGQHPHRKPIDVLVQLIDALPAGIVVDPFAGSGSTLVAAKLLGRPAIGIEIDPECCARAARRCSQDTLGLLTA